MTERWLVPGKSAPPQKDESMTEAEAIRWAVAAVGFVIDLVTSLGHRDPVLAALDATFAAARQKNRDDLTAKHHTKP